MYGYHLNLKLFLKIKYYHFFYFQILNVQNYQKISLIIPHYYYESEFKINYFTNYSANYKMNHDQR